MMGMSEDELLVTLKAEEADASSFHNSELAKHQQDALDRFYGRAYGDEEAHRSKVVTRDLETTINWLMPDLMRTFRNRDELVSVKSMTPEDDAPGAQGRSKVDLIAAYLAHCLFDDNDGLTAIYDFAFDGLLMRQGVMKAGWADPEAKPPRELHGVSVQALTRYVNDPEYKILEAAPSVSETDEGDDEGTQEATELGETGAEAGADEGQQHEQAEQIAPGQLWDIKVIHKPRMGRVYCEAVPSEEFAIEKSAKSVVTSKYHRRKTTKFIADLAQMFPAKAAALRDRKTSTGSDLFADARAVSRSPESQRVGDRLNDKGREECELIEEYIRIDYDGDGIVELRCIKRVDDVILENETVDRSEFVVWTPNRVAHRIAGRSLYDLLGDLQKIRTVITRRFLDGLGQALTPRTYVNTRGVGAAAMDAIAANDIGGVIGIDGNPKEFIYEAVTPDVSGAALQALDHFDAGVAEASGVTKQAQGMDPQAMNKTATGIDLLQAAAKVRIEMIATWLGKAMEDVFKLILHTVVAHQDGPRQLKLFGEFVEVDPRTWSDENAVSVHVGSAGVSRNQRLANLGLIAQKQEQVLMTAGAGNPLVTLQHLRATYAEMVSNMGFRDSEQFFGQIPKDWQPPPQPEDPKAAAEKARLEMDGAKAQQTAQLDATKMQHQQALAEAEFQHKTRLAELDAQTQRELAVLKINSEREMAQMKMAAEQQLARERLEREMEMARIRADREHDLASRKHENDVKLNGFRPGGVLDA